MIASVVTRCTVRGNEHFQARYWANSGKTAWYSHSDSKPAKKLKSFQLYARDCVAIFLRSADGLHY